MKELIKKWNLKKHFLSSLLLIVVIKGISLYFVKNVEKVSGSIGIIGGSDGPTSIYVASNIGGFILENMIILLIFLIMMLMYLPIKYIRERYNAK